ncbi:MULTISPECIES: sugar ABC transporter ATP-binding protein [unclassified Mycolicibacterium]|uniref:sugar ABC transporter ATP-binding protein n=1 Tax=unclassified Mycolicibacterium TaxID=2636767 RepID=UPI00192E48EE|nr:MULTISPECIES: sugar ABC transporter ATP-binding protein [unclassified Mycolicibacterium]
MALNGVSIAVEPGTIHALLGGNGSGKSTLIKILAGIVPADAGEFEFEGDVAEVSAYSAAKAKAMGLRFVHQQSSTFDDLTVAENLAIGRGFIRSSAGRIRWGRQRRRAAEVLDRFSIPATPDTLVRELGSATQMMIAIARALQDQGDARDGVLVLDEPTASLTRNEVDTLLDALLRYAAAGQSIIYVTHRLDEVIRIADNATVLRDGRVSEGFTKGQLAYGQLVEAIMGEALASLTREEMAKEMPAGGAPVAELRGDDGLPLLTVGAGECVAVAGLLGSGRSSLLRRIFGVLPRPGEELRIDGRSVRAESPRHAIRAGIGLVPEDRPRDALFAGQSISQNLSIVALDEMQWMGAISVRAERARARKLIEAFHVRTASELTSIGSLSGGNQQKVVVARWLQRTPRLLLLDEPTQGVDVGARAEIHGFVRNAVENGAAAIVVSSDFDELIALGDRAIIMRDGRIVDEARGSDFTEDSLNALVYSQEANE